MSYVVTPFHLQNVRGEHPNGTFDPMGARFAGGRMVQKTRQTSGLAGGSAAKMRRHSYPDRRSGIGTGWRCWFMLLVGNGLRKNIVETFIDNPGRGTRSFTPVVIYASQAQCLSNHRSYVVGFNPVICLDNRPDSPPAGRKTPCLFTKKFTE
jgi:hypothetical protein